MQKKALKCYRIFFFPAVFVVPSAAGRVWVGLLLLEPQLLHSLFLQLFLGAAQPWEKGPEPGGKNTR